MGGRIILSDIDGTLVDQIAAHRKVERLLVSRLVAKGISRARARRIVSGIFFSPGKDPDYDVALSSLGLPRYAPLVRRFSASLRLMPGARELMRKNRVFVVTSAFRKFQAPKLARFGLVPAGWFSFETPGFRKDPAGARMIARRLKPSSAVFFGDTTEDWRFSRMLVRACGCPVEFLLVRGARHYSEEARYQEFPAAAKIRSVRRLRAPKG